MKFLSQKLSAKLEKLGLESESEMWWFKKYTNNKKFFLEDFNYPKCGCLTKMVKGFIKNGIVLPAYTLSDILQKENLQKLFPNICENTIGEWKYHGLILLEVYWKNRLGGVEKYLKQNIKE